MEDWRVIALIVGIVGAVVGVYFREALRKAHQQKNAAVKLEAQITIAVSEFLESESISKLFTSVESLRKRVEDALLKYGKDGEHASAKIFIEIKQEINTLLKKDDSSVNDIIENACSNAKNLPQEVIDSLLKHYELMITSILNGTIILSPNEASLISRDAVIRTIKVSGAAVTLLRNLIIFIQFIREPLENNMPAIRDVLADLMVNLIVVSMQLIPLKEEAQKISNTSTLSLAVKGLIE